MKNPYDGGYCFANTTWVRTNREEVIAALKNILYTMDGFTPNEYGVSNEVEEVGGDDG